MWIGLAGFVCLGQSAHHVADLCHFRGLCRHLHRDPQTLDAAKHCHWRRIRGHATGVELQQWCDSATQALAEPEEARASPQQTKQDRKRIRELERELHRKDKALAETAALLVLSRKLEAVFNKDKGEAE